MVGWGKEGGNGSSGQVLWTGDSGHWGCSLWGWAGQACECRGAGHLAVHAACAIVVYEDVAASFMCAVVVGPALLASLAAPGLIGRA